MHNETFREKCFENWVFQCFELRKKWFSSLTGIPSVIFLHYMFDEYFQNCVLFLRLNLQRGDRWTVPGFLIVYETKHRFFLVEPQKREKSFIQN